MRAQMLRDVEVMLAVRASDGDNADVGFATGNDADHFKAAYAGDIEINNYDAERVVVFIEKPECCVPVSRKVGRHIRAYVVPVREYLLDVLPGLDTRKLSDIARLTPGNWSAGRG
jgi:hypothetical protein